MGDKSRRKLVRGAKILAVFGLIAGVVAAALPNTPAHAANASGDFIMIQLELGHGIARINPDGSGFHPYITQPNTYTGGWSSDGSKFAYRVYDDGWHVGVYDVVSNRNNGIVASGEFEGWTPDGRVVYSPKDGAPGAFMTVSPMGANTGSYSYHTPAGSTLHTLSPDGTKVAYVSNDGVSAPFIAVSNVGSAASVHIAPSAGTQRIAWSQSGTITFDSIDPSTGSYAVYVANAQASGAINVSGDLPNAAHNPSISPDGATIVFSMPDPQMDGAIGIFTRTIPNGTPRRVASGYVLDPQWRPNVPSLNHAPVVSAGEDAEVRTATDYQLHGDVVDDGRPAPAQTGWTIVSGPGSVTFADSSNPETTVRFSELGTYVLRLSASDGEFTGEDTVQVKVYDEYRAELKAWIPQQTVVDPMAPNTFQLLSGLVGTLDNSQNLRSCIQQVASTTNPLAAITITAAFEGDNRTGYGATGQATPDYRVRSWATFRWDGNEISHFEQGGGYGQTTRIITATRNGQTVTCKQHATAPQSELVPGMVAIDKKSFTLTVKGQNPLTPNQANSDNFGNIVNTFCAAAPTGPTLCHAALDNIPLTPAIDGTATGTFSSQGNLTFGYDTDFFPDYGISITRNDQTTDDVVVNQASCANTTGVLGAANLFARLNTELGLPRNTGQTTVGTSFDRTCDPLARIGLATASTAIILPIVPIEPLLFPPVTYLP